MTFGKVERREFNYIRHGTQVLIANIHLATGQILAPTIQQTRTELDFVEPIRQTVATDPHAPWIFLCDQLNIHLSASLVEYVALSLEDQTALGAKGKQGILASMASRQAYLSAPSHRIRFVYTPKHCSWLNSIEVWFSTLTRHILSRGNFSSIADLKLKIERYISFYNLSWAKPYVWSVIENRDIRELIQKVMLHADLFLH
jgi:transposase